MGINEAAKFLVDEILKNDEAFSMRDRDSDVLDVGQGSDEIKKNSCCS